MSHSITANQLAQKVKDKNDKADVRMSVSHGKRRGSKRAKSLASSNPVFTAHKWGDSTNAGVNYSRPYNKTTGSAKAYMKSLGA